MPGTMNHGAVGNVYRTERLSPSPPAQPSVNKRDKRRIALQDRLNDIITNFAGNRDVYYRKQLQEYHTDINYITHASLYDNKPLPEQDEEVSEQTTVNGTGSHRQGLTNGIAKAEPIQTLGRHAARFIQDVNDAVEQRDADLVTLAYNHNFAIHEWEKDYTFSVEVAEREQQRLLDSLRQRLIQNVNQKITALQREKEKLDIADTNALLHHPTQFSINSVASPGGVHSNRKTRHTRHRQDAEDAENAVVNNGNNTGNKRKRKAGPDNEMGSPGPSSHRDMELLNGLAFKEPLSRPGTATAPVIPTIDKLFSDKELTINLQQATFDVVQASSASSSSKRRRADYSSPKSQVLHSKPDQTEMEEDVTAPYENLPTVLGPETSGDTFAVAVSMDRTPSQLYHATRSAGRLQSSATPLNTLGELAGRQAGAELLGTHVRSNEKAKRDGDEYSRAPPLTEQEAMDDVRLMEAAMRQEEAEAGADDEGDQKADENDDEISKGTIAGPNSRKLLDILLADEQVDYLGPPSFPDNTKS